MSPRFRRPLIWPHLLLLGILLLLTLYSAKQWQLNANMADMFAESGSEQSQAMALLTHQLQQGPASRLIFIRLVADDSQNEKQLAQLSQSLYRQLQPLLNNGELSQLQNGSSLVDNGALDSLFRYRYLLLEQPPLSENELSSGVDRIEQLLQTLLPPTQLNQLRADPTSAWWQVLSSWQQQNFTQQHGVWFDQTGAAILLALGSASGLDLKAQQQLVSDIESAFAALPAAQRAQASLQLVGVPVFALASQASIRQQATLLTGIGSALLMLFLFWRLRSVSQVLLGGVVLASAVLVAVSVTLALMGELFAITLAFGMILMGIAIDYPLHLFAHSPEQDKSNERDNSPEPEHHQNGKTALGTIWPAIRLGLISTLIGLGAMAMSGFAGLTQLALFAGSGLVTAALLTRFYLPALLQPVKRALPKEPDTRTVSLPLQWTLAALVTALAIGVLLLNDNYLEDDLARLSPLQQGLKTLDGTLRSQSGRGEVRHFLYVSGENSEQVLQKLERMSDALTTWQQQGLIAGYRSPSRWLPSVHSQKQRQQSLPDTEALQQRLESALQNSPLSRAAFEPFVMAVAESRQLPPLTQNDLQKTPLATLLSQQLFALEGRWYGLVTLQGVTPGFIGALKNSELPAHYLDTKSQTEQLLAEYRQGAAEYLLWGLLLITLLLILQFRRPSTWLKIVLTLSLGLLVTTALLVLLGERLSHFHLVSLLLVAGLSLDYLIVIHHRRYDVRARWSINTCAGSTLLMFSLLALSTTPVLHAIGLTTALGVLVVWGLSLWLMHTSKQPA